jgi:hypothetical protein
MRRDPGHGGREVKIKHKLPFQRLHSCVLCVYVTFHSNSKVVYLFKGL